MGFRVRPLASLFQLLGVGAAIQARRAIKTPLAIAAPMRPPADLPAGRPPKREKFQAKLDRRIREERQAGKRRKR